jgi:hypothetical protein
MRVVVDYTRKHDLIFIVCCRKMNRTKGGLGKCASMLLETPSVCQRWGVVPPQVSYRLHTIRCFQLTYFHLRTVSVQITDYLEQRCYKELRSEHYGYAKVVVLIYRRLLVSCKEQM